MTKKKSSRASSVKKKLLKGVPVEKEPVRVARGARRRRETRGRLLDSAMRLMAEKGMEGVAINEITEAADVGFGSFYNHFSSKEEIYDALVDSVFGDFADALDTALADITDPAEVLAISVRHTLYHARRDPDWARFLLREGLSARAISHGLGNRLLRDIRKGVTQGRFSGESPLTIFVSVAGGVLIAVSLELHLDSTEQLSVQLLEDLEMPGDDFPERIAAGLLIAIGIPTQEARQIARLPLPEIPEGRWRIAG